MHDSDVEFQGESKYANKNWLSHTSGYYISKMSEKSTYKWDKTGISGV